MKELYGNYNESMDVISSTAVEVLHLSAATVYGGGEEHVRTVLKALHERGVPVGLASPSESPLGQKVRALGIPCFDLSFGGKFDPTSGLRLARLVKSVGARFVHSHNRREDLALYLSGLFLPQKVKRITTVHDRLNVTAAGKRVGGLNGFCYRKIMESMDLLLTVSEATTEDLMSLIPQVKNKVMTVTNGCDLLRLDSFSDPQTLRASWNVNGTHLLVLLSARVRGNRFDKKGHLRLIDAVAQCQEYSQEKNVVWEIVFAGEDDKARELLIAYAQQRSVTIHPQGLVEDVGALYRAVDLVALPSLFEGLPRALMEAMACGRPVLGTRTDGIVELLEGGESGLLVEVGSVEDLARGLRIAQDATLRQTIAERGQDRVRSKYTASAMADDHIAAYHRLGFLQTFKSEVT